jgi:hypothetical protein
MSDLRLLVRSHFQGSDLNPDSPLNRGWRKSHVLPELESFLTGKKSIRIGNLRSNTPFRFETHASEG